jgi:hypothetical protein
MVRRFTVLAIALLVLGATVAGCGSDDKKSSDSGSDNSSKSSDSGGSSGGSVKSPQAKQAVANCKKSVSQAPNIKADIKSDLQGICEKAGSGDEAAVRKATKEVCVKIVESSAPAGPARDQAKKACDAAQTGKVPSY